MENQLDELERIDWDMLLVLDSVRWDVWEDMVGGGYKVRSPGSCTVEFVNSLTERFDLSDTDCVTANPEVTRQTIRWEFKERTDFWKREWEIINGISYVDDKKVASSILSKVISGRGDRVYGHLMGGHWPYPFSDPPVPALRCNPEATEVDVDDDGVGDQIITDVAEKAKDSGHYLTEELILEGYRRNIRYSFGAISDILDCKDTVVITSDHGELLLGDGENYGHPPGSDRRELREVPFVVIE